MSEERTGERLQQSPRVGAGVKGLHVAQGWTLAADDASGGVDLPVQDSSAAHTHTQVWSSSFTNASQESGQSRWRKTSVNVSQEFDIYLNRISSSRHKQKLMTNLYKCAHLILTTEPGVCVQRGLKLVP